MIPLNGHYLSYWLKTQPYSCSISLKTILTIGACIYVFLPNTLLLCNRHYIMCVWTFPVQCRPITESCQGSLNRWQKLNRYDVVMDGKVTRVCVTLFTVIKQNVVWACLCLTTLFCQDIRSFIKDCLIH